MKNSKKMYGWMETTKKARHCKRNFTIPDMAIQRRFLFGSSKGFTLVELVLVISIVVVLSVISGPIYRSYAYKARQAEGYALIGTIRSAQESYYGEYGTFLRARNSSSRLGNSNYTCNEEVLGIDARPNKYYTWFDVAWQSDGGQGGDSTIAYAFLAEVQGSGAANIYMIYNRTSGVTMASGDRENIDS